ncbi:hypothetical protein PTKIN_Ptkin14bG0214300 [Pterospermum kingtungense]
MQMMQVEKVSDYIFAWNMEQTNGRKTINPLELLPCNLRYIVALTSAGTGFIYSQATSTV